MLRNPRQVFLNSNLTVNAGDDHEERHGETPDERRTDGLSEEEKRELHHETEEFTANEERYTQAAQQSIERQSSEILATSFSLAESMTDEEEADEGSHLIEEANHITLDMAPGDIIAREEIVPLLTEMRDLLRVMSGNNQDPDTCYHMAKRYLKFAYGLTVGTGKIVMAVYGLYVLFKALSNVELVMSNGNDSTLDDNKQALKLIFNTWQALPEKEWWLLFSNYVRGNSYLTINDQIVFLQFTMQLSPLQPILWQSNNDRLTISNEIVAFYKATASCTIADLYLQITEKKYQEKPLPRAAAANELILALSQILIEKCPIKKPTILSLKTNIPVIELGDTQDDVFKALDIVGTLSWATPYGPYVSAAIQAVEWIFGKKSSSQGVAIDFSSIFTAMGKLQESILRDVQITLEHENLRKLLEQIKVNSEFMNNFYYTYSENKDLSPNDLSDAIIKGNGYLQTLTEITDTVRQDSFFYIITALLNELNDEVPGLIFKFGYDNDYYNLSVAKFRALITAISLYLTALKQTIMCQKFVKYHEDLSASDTATQILKASLNEEITFANMKAVVSSLPDKKSYHDQVELLAESLIWGRMIPIKVGGYSDNSGPNFNQLLYTSISHAESLEWSAVSILEPNHERKMSCITSFWSEHKSLSVHNELDLSHEAATSVPCGGYTLDDPFIPSNASYFLPGNVILAPTPVFPGVMISPKPMARNAFLKDGKIETVGTDDTVDKLQTYYYTVLNLSEKLLLNKIQSTGETVTDSWKETVRLSSFGIPVQVTGELSLDNSHMIPAKANTMWSVKNAWVRYGVILKRTGSPDSNRVWTDWLFVDNKEQPDLNLSKFSIGEIIDEIVMCRQFGIGEEFSPPKEESKKQLVNINIWGPSDKVNGKFPISFTDTIAVPFEQYSQSFDQKKVLEETDESLFGSIIAKNSHKGLITTSADMFFSRTATPHASGLPNSGGSRDTRKIATLENLV